MLRSFGGPLTGFIFPGYFFLFNLLLSGKLYKAEISTEKNKESRSQLVKTAFYLF